MPSLSIGAKRGKFLRLLYALRRGIFGQLPRFRSSSGQNFSGSCQFQCGMILWWSMIASEHRPPLRIKSGAGLRRIMR